jgi:hypothetical protein
MDFGKFQFATMKCATIKIDGVTYEYDVVIDLGKICKRKKKPSKKFREKLGHTPVSVEEEVPWKCRSLVIGTGRYGSPPIMDDVKREARRRKIDLLILPTDEGGNKSRASENLRLLAATRISRLIRRTRTGRPT